MIIVFTVKYVHPTETILFLIIFQPFYISSKIEVTFQLEVTPISSAMKILN